MAFPCRALVVLLLISAVHAQDGGAKANTTVGWQPWLVGLTAVTVFLFIVFAALIINRVLCTKKEEPDRFGTNLNPDERVAASNAYSNLAVNIDSDKMTSL
ncbi:small integral membrane protein 24-like [Heptranchias perlo]|uniref:small integral membrane protein 24-like n=1 Tax=Heptranchias perlo TaxID=212740 RepID=UPI0035597A03